VSTDFQVKSHKAKGTRVGIASRCDWQRGAFFLLPFSFFLVAGCAADGFHFGSPQTASSMPNFVGPPDKYAQSAVDPNSSVDGRFEWWNISTWGRPKEVPPPPADTLVIRGDQIIPDSAGPNKRGSGDLASAHELYRQGKFDDARKIFEIVAEDKKVLPTLAEEARFYQAECHRREEHYPTACDTYHLMLMDFPNGSFREQAIQRMYDIANYWLEDTRKEMEAKEKGEHHFFGVTPIMHFESTKPLIDEEGRALEALEELRYADIHGPLADKALFLAGTVKFWREDYRDADSYFTQLVESHPNSPLAPRAAELGIIAKQMGTGGADYDGRKVAEARKLIQAALQNYPSLARDPDKEKFLTRQLVSCNMQQAEKDFKIAEFYRRTDHPGSAYFYYEIVRRRYPGTKYADDATNRMHEIHAKVEKEEQEKIPAVPAMKTPDQPKKPPEVTPAPRPISPAPQDNLAPAGR
jgi:outer membrane protein assembly factor BamD (BamD/ComL family)